jgi:methylmalonyl-CoA/ethylmalonyl-CoA epimerase
MLRKIHHINFLVRDLDQAIGRYENLFGVSVERRERLKERRVETARFRIDDTWIVLVQPLDSQSVPGRHLEQHGEGFFLISYQVDDVSQAAGTVEARGATLINKTPRRGLDDWQVIDIASDDTLGVQSQLLQSDSR